MNSKFLLIAFVFGGLCSCTTAYKIGQTPDDVYYSPAPQQEVYVNATNEEERPVYNSDIYNSSSENREIRMRINHRRLRSYDYDYGYNYPLTYPNSYGYNYPYIGYDYNGYNYNYPYYNYNYPYNYSTIYIDPKIVQVQQTYTGPRKYNLGTYTRPSISANSIRPSNSGTAPVRSFTKPANNGTGVGNLIRKVFSSPDVNTRTYNNDNNSQQTRTFESSRNTSSNNNSSAPSSSSTSNNSSSAPVRTFHK